MINFTQEEINLLNHLKYLLNTNHPEIEFTLGYKFLIKQEPIIKANIPEMLGETAARKREEEIERNTT